MGTRCLTIVYNEQGQPLVNLYRQYDGYPSGHGVELAEFLQDFNMISGIGAKTEQRTANGMGCLAAQVVAHFKESVGGFYIYSVEDTDCGQDYEYHVYAEAGNLCVRVKDRGCNMFGLTMSDKDECIFNGPVAKFFDYCYEDA
jgi:hypothetical protein